VKNSFSREGFGLSFEAAKFEFLGLDFVFDLQTKSLGLAETLFEVGGAGMMGFDGFFEDAETAVFGGEGVSRSLMRAWVGGRCAATSRVVLRSLSRWAIC
jgi:hypothetical protein